MADYKALTLDECVDKILAAKHPLVVMHVRPDGDTVGSGAALCKIFAKLGKSADYTSADPIPERLSHLVSGLTRCDDYDGREAVSIDVASPAQLGSIADAVSVSLMIDHHAVSTPFAPHYTLPDASSAGEVLYNIACELERRSLLTIDKDIAALLYAAISSDTGGFIFSSASESTYLAAARLVSLGIDHAEINRRLFHSKPYDQLRAEGFVAAKIKTADGGRIAYATITKGDRDALSLQFSAFECAIDVVRSLLGAECSFVIKETDGGEYKVSLRSTGKNVAEIAAAHGGGGHIRAAGCTVKAESIDAAEQMLLSALMSNS